MVEQFLRGAIDRRALDIHQHKRRNHRVLLRFVPAAMGELDAAGPPPRELTPQHLAVLFFGSVSRKTTLCGHLKTRDLAAAVVDDILLGRGLALV